MGGNAGRCSGGEWYKHAFTELYPVVYAHRSVEAAEPEVRFATTSLGLCRDDSVLDLCCGDGRHLVHLNHFAGTLTGLDYSPPLLRIAQKRTPSARLVRADMRAIPFRGTFDAVVSFFTSFGYFECADDNERVVREAANALIPGGRFFIDYVNAAYVTHTLMPESERSAGGYQIRERRWITQAPWRVHKTTQVTCEGRIVEESVESVQLYTPDEFVALLEAGGLRVERLAGNFSGVPVCDTEPRLIAIGRRS